MLISQRWPSLNRDMNLQVERVEHHGMDNVEVGKVDVKTSKQAKENEQHGDQTVSEEAHGSGRWPSMTAGSQTQQSHCHTEIQGAPTALHPSLSTTITQGLLPQGTSPHQAMSGNEVA